MSSNLNEKIKQFNEAVLEQELTCAFLIKQQVQTIFNDLELASKRTDKSVQTQLMDSLDDALKDILHANNKESLLIKTERLTLLIENIERILGFSSETKPALHDYRLMIAIMKVAKQANHQDKSLEQLLPHWCKDHHDYETWLKRLESLQNQVSRDRFLEKKMNCFMMSLKRFPIAT